MRYAQTAGQRQRKTASGEHHQQAQVSKEVGVHNNRAMLSSAHLNSNDWNMAAKRLARKALEQVANDSMARMPGIKGKTVEGRVVTSPPNSAFCEVDCALRSLATVPKKEINPSGQVNQFETHPFVVEYLWTPFQEPQVVPARQSSHRLSRTWAELKQCMRSRVSLRGRVLNPLNGGYAIGVGGYVAFMPHRESPLSVDIGALIPIRVLQMRESNTNVVVGSAEPFRQRSFARGRSQEESQRGARERRGKGKAKNRTATGLPSTGGSSPRDGR